MAQLWTKDENGTWVQANLSTKTSTGWKYASKVYEKTGSSVWTQRWARDTTAPQPPTVTYTNNTTTKTTQFSIQISSDTDVQTMVIKGGNGAYPSTPSLTVLAPHEFIGTYTDTDGTMWSQRSVTPGLTVTRNSSGFTSGNTYYYAIWVQDTSGNWSAPRLVTFKFPYPPAPVPTLVTKTYVTNCTDSGAWMGDDNYWRTDNNYVYQAGRDSYGAWFYGGRLKTALAYAKEIKKVTIRITRVNSQHGVAGAADVHLCAHGFLSQPTTSPEGKFSPTTTGVFLGTLNRGETKTFNVPSAWWPYIKSGGNAGFGLRYGTSSFTSNKYMQAYGAGTTSGQIYLEWTQ